MSPLIIKKISISILQGGFSITMLTQELIHGTAKHNTQRLHLILKNW